MIQLHMPVILAFAFAAFTFSSNASADLFLTMSIDDGNSFGNSFDVEAGESLTIGIWAQEDGSNTEFSTEGLVSFGFDLELLDSNAGEISDANQNPLFDVENFNSSSSTGFQWEFGEGSGSGVSGQSILLGTFEFDVAGDRPAVFNLTDRIPGSGVGAASWITPSFGLLDEQVFGTGATGSYGLTLNVTAVPEPNSACLVSLAFCSFLLRNSIDESDGTTKRPRSRSLT
jgi:hypothetical protein